MNKETARAEDEARPPAALSLAIDKAINTSYHAGVAWLIVKGNSVRFHHGWVALFNQSGSRCRSGVFVESSL